MFNIKFFILLFVLFILYNNIYEHFDNTENENKLKNAFNDTINMIKDINIPYMLGYGTAIGALRNGKLIPYDHDVDIIIFYKDLRNKFGNIRTMTRVFNTIGKKYNFKPVSEISTPYLYRKNSYCIPIMFQYRHTITNIPVDFYIFFEKNGKYWDFAGGGEHTGKGLCYPSIKNTYGYVYGKEYPVMPIEIIEMMYGKNWKTPLQKSEYTEMKKIQYNSDNELDNEWLIE